MVPALEMGMVAKVPVLAGINTDEGATFVFDGVPWLPMILYEDAIRIVFGQVCRTLTTTPLTRPSLPTPSSTITAAMGSTMGATGSASSSQTTGSVARPISSLRLWRPSEFFLGGLLLCI